VSTRSVLHDKSNSGCVSPSSDKAVSAWILLVLLDSKIENGVLLDTLRRSPAFGPLKNAQLHTVAANPLSAIFRFYQQKRFNPNANKLKHFRN